MSTMLESLGPKKIAELLDFKSFADPKFKDVDYIRVDYMSSKECKRPLFSLLIPKDQCKEWIELGQKFVDKGWGEKK